MKRITIICLLVLLILLSPACSGLNDAPDFPDSDNAVELPPESPDEVERVEEEVAQVEKENDNEEEKMLQFNSEGISFIYPNSLARDVVLEQHVGYPDDELAPIPDFITLSFTGYILSDTFMSPVIYIFEAEEYRAINDYAGQTINLLEEGLADSATLDDASELPFLPLFNAAQIFHSNALFIDFQGGSGLRYLTTYAQDFIPVINDFLFYTFQGLTDDGRYYVSLIMPVNHPALPADLDEFFSSIDDDHETFYDNYREFLEADIEMLDQSNDEMLTPALNILDDLVMTLRVE